MCSEIPNDLWLDSLVNSVQNLVCFRASLIGQIVKTTVLVGNYGCFFFPSPSLKAFILCEGGRLRPSVSCPERGVGPTHRPTDRVYGLSDALNVAAVSE